MSFLLTTKFGLLKTWLCVLAKHKHIRKTIWKGKYWAEVLILITTIQITCSKALLLQSQCSHCLLRYSLVWYEQLYTWLPCRDNLGIQDKLLNRYRVFFLTYPFLSFLGSKSGSEALSCKQIKLISHAKSSAKLRPCIFYSEYLFESWCQHSWQMKWIHQDCQCPATVNRKINL